MEALVCKYELKKAMPTIEFRSKVIECFIRNGIEGRLLNSLENGIYDSRIERMTLYNPSITPLEFTKNLICEELC